MKKRFFVMVVAFLVIGPIGIAGAADINVTTTADEYNTDEDVQLMVAYHIAKKTLIYVHEDGEIKGVFMWYNCNHDDNWNFVQDWTPDRPDGDSVFLAFLFSESTPYFKELTELFLESEDTADKRLLGIRYRNGFPKRVEYKPELFKKILL